MYEVCVEQLGLFDPRQDYEQAHFKKKLVDPSEMLKITNYLHLAQNSNLSNENCQMYFFNNNARHTMVLCKRMFVNLEAVEGINFEFIDSLKNNGTKFFCNF